MNIKSSRTQDGFIMVLTLMVIAIAVLVVTKFSQRSTTHTHFNRLVIDREKAAMLAWSGVQLAMSQLHIEQPKKEKAKEGKDQSTAPAKKDEKKEDPKAAFIQKVLPLLNQLQTFKLTQATDGIDGAIKICITSEDGKININDFYDFGKGAMREEKPFKDLFAFVATQLKEMVGADVGPGIEKLFSAENIALNDVTDLMRIPAMNAYFKNNLWFIPGEKKPDQKKSPLALSDIFTTWTYREQLHPLLLSPGVLQLLGIRSSTLKGTSATELANEIGSKIISPEKLWDDRLKKIYGKDYKSLPAEIKPFLSAIFEPSAFSVLSYGTVGSVTQKILVIIHRTTTYETISEEFDILKIYWL